MMDQPTRRAIIRAVITCLVDLGFTLHVTAYVITATRVTPTGGVQLLKLELGRATVRKWDIGHMPGDTIRGRLTRHSEFMDLKDWINASLLMYTLI